MTTKTKKNLMIKSTRCLSTRTLTSRMRMKKRARMRRVKRRHSRDMTSSSTRSAT
jgi:hypothetical protein